jgi:hypothetical protein
MIFVLCVVGGLHATPAVDRWKARSVLVYSLTPVFLGFVYSRISTPIYVDRIFLGSCILLPMVFCAPIAFQTGTRRKVYQLTVLLVLMGNVVSTFGYPRRERKEDWRGVTEYLLKLSERRRLEVIVPDHCQVLVQYYAARLGKSYPPLQMTGPLTKFDPPDRNLLTRLLDDYRRRVDILALLSQAMASGKYEEVDVAMLKALPPLFKPVLEYLPAHCAALEVVEFNRLEVRRCLVRSTLPIRTDPESLRAQFYPAD